MPVGGEQSIADQKSSAGNPCPDRGWLIHETNLIYAVNVANGVPIAAEHEGGHPLLFLEFRHLLGKGMYLLLQVIRLGILGRGRRIVVEHGYGADQQHGSEDSLNGLLPALGNFA